MEINDYFLRYILTSVYSTKNLIISPPGKGINIFVKELIKKISNVSTELYKKNKISIVLIKSQKIKDTIFVNSESLKAFLNELKTMNIPESIIKEYSLTILNNQKRTINIKEEKWRRIIFPKSQYSSRRNKKIVNNKYYNYNLSDYFIKKEKIFKISKNNINNNRNEKYKELNNKKNILLLGKKRNLSYNDLVNLTKEKNNNQLSSSISSINIEDNAFQYIPSLFTTSPSLLNNNENNDIDYNINSILKSNDYKMKEKSNKKRGILSTLKDVSRETLFFLIQKQNTTIEEITKYIFNMANLKTVHGKAQTYNNIQRRVYDTINVLQGLNKIEKKGFLQIHYILSEKEKKEIIIMKKQKELIIKLYLLYVTNISNMNYKSFYKNIKYYLNYNYLLMNKEQYLVSNEILEYTKERILEFSKDISGQIYDYINEKNLFKKFRIYLLNYDKLLMCKFLQNEKNKDNKSPNNIEEDKNTTNNINTTYSKINTNDSSINHQKETFFDIYKNNNENDNIESPLNNIGGATNINNINLLNVNKFQNLNQLYFNNNNTCLNNINNPNLNSLNNNNFFNFISDY